MKSDEGFSDMSDKSILNQLVNENVIPIKLTNLKKAAFLQPFFLKITHTLEILKVAKSRYFSYKKNKNKRSYKHN